MKRFRPTAFLGFAISPLVFGGLVQDQDSAIQNEYLSAKPTDAVSKLVEQVRGGAVKLSYEPKQGYLRSVLKELGISPTSQILVFSKTSLQTAFISPLTPRAIYFNDHAYVGWIPGAPNIEIASVDPQVGPIFYTLHNVASTKPALQHQTLECLQCHDSPMTKQIPGVMARSVYAGADGQLRLAGGSYLTTAKSPMSERWGGWYVTGAHGEQRHMGNEVARGSDENPTIDEERGANVTDLKSYFDVDSYLSPHSDIVALMVAEQQMEIQNLITKAGFVTRSATKDSVNLLKYGFTADHVKEETDERIRHACEPLVEALLCSGEPPLTDPVKGTSGFTAYFSKSSRPDENGRRLSELDLKTRLLRYPCSPMIYSEAFDGLPPEAKEAVFKRLDDVLSGKDQSQPFASLTVDDRKAILEILRDTLPEFPKTE
ncbi:MAG TPA: hypothetical protein VG944_07255 [Fimbriimonas sp.]|nr:hypothetical protein [Fimbriimonas sp.]